MITNHHSEKQTATVMVLGGGVAGMRAAVDLAEAGIRVKLVESSHGLGGRVAQLGFMFPTHDCVLCRGTSDHGYGCTRPSISPAFLEHNLHPNIEVWTNTQVLDASGEAGDFTISLRRFPRYVDPDRCTNCGRCAEICPVEKPRGFEAGLTKRRAAYKVAPRAIPNSYVIDRGPYCDDCHRCAQVCPTCAIDLNESVHDEDVHVDALILAVGHQLYDPHHNEEFGYGRYANVITSMEYERLASRSGPTEGLVTRPSDSTPPKKIAWLQCIGSRDQTHPYCSSICCMYATKEAMLAKQRIPGVECRIFTMDERAFNKEYTAYLQQARDKYKIDFTRCRLSGLKEDPQTKNLVAQFVTEDGTRHQDTFDLVVLSVGMEPPAQATAIAKRLGIHLNAYGFCETDKFAPLQTNRSGVFVCGAFQSPKEIAESIIDASGAATEVMRLLSHKIGNAPHSRQYPFLARNGEFPPERDVANEPARTAVFVCSCGDAISQVVNTDALTAYAEKLPNVVYAAQVSYLCMAEGQARLRHAIEERGANRVVVAACSHRTHESLFQRVVREAALNPNLIEMANIREHCAWAHRKNPSGATRKAEELVRMAAARATKLVPVYKEGIVPTSRALIIGGGVSGMSAALAIADTGYQVTLVERNETLGGNLNNLYFTAEGGNPQRLMRDLINRVVGHNRIQVFLRSQVVKHQGSVGRFQSVISTHVKGATRPVNTPVEHGVTIVATGGQEHHGEHYLLGKDPRVISQHQLEEQIVNVPERIADLKQVVMIQCAREADKPEYCSRICCTNTMKNATRIKMLNPNCEVIVLFKNIITYGFREQYYTEARRRGVLFVRYTDETQPKVEIRDERGEMKEWGDTPSDISLTSLQVTAHEPILKKELGLNPDLLVISTQVTPADGTPQLAELLHVPLSSEGFYLEAHLKMRPMDFMEEGIFIAGMAHYPKFIEESISHALAAAGRAITILSQEPLYIGGVVAQVDQSKCVGCLTCTRTCPFGIPRIDPKAVGNGSIVGAAWIDPAKCQGCGTCTGECPATAIQLVNYRDEQIMLKETAGLGAWVPA
ncbi:MAG: CoB--CoM heterodisulfide reductase iron-sulfur subunit A family protein [Chloroflexi bacterium]|nr:CoB--CoM heterodisulfide reductase iron-sulfur subunit A family protein [Chloroflexota bacterium]